MVHVGKFDPHSFSEPEDAATINTKINWRVSFRKKKLRGTVTHTLEIFKLNLSEIPFDISDIKIKNVRRLLPNQKLKYTIGNRVDGIGSKLTVFLPKSAASKVGKKIKVHIEYETSRNASGLHWLIPDQTLEGEWPLVYSHCHPIHARSLMPCQDTPSIRFTYHAIVQHPMAFTVLMSGVEVESRLVKMPIRTCYSQDKPIPPSSLAIICGIMESQQFLHKWHIHGEQRIISACIAHFIDFDKAFRHASKFINNLYWKSFDLIVMPPGYPFDVMDYPNLFVVPLTLLGEVKTLRENIIARLVGHCLSRNLPGISNFQHYWLEMGLAACIELKIIGRMRSYEERDFQTIRIIEDMTKCIGTQFVDNPQLTQLVIDMSNYLPEEALSSLSYSKGYTFLHYIENLVGGPQAFEPFLRYYLTNFAFKPMVSLDFKDALNYYFGRIGDDVRLNEIDWDLWLYQKGMPPIIPEVDKKLSNHSNRLSYIWSIRQNIHLRTVPEDIRSVYSITVIIDFLDKLCDRQVIYDLNDQKIYLLELIYSLDNSESAELRFRMVRLYIRARLMCRIGEIIDFVNSFYIIKYSVPIYRDLAQWPEAKPIAVHNFLNFIAEMEDVCSDAIAKVLGLN